MASAISDQKTKGTSAMSVKIFFSGENLKVEEFMASRPKDFPEAGILLSYWTLRNGNRCYRRMVWTIKENKECK